MKQFDPTIFKWMAFLTGYVLPKDYFEKVGAEGFEKKPIGTGPYMVDAYQGNAFLRLKANPKYWGGKPAFETVVFKFVTDATSRVAEIESGSSDLTLEIPYEEFDRLKAKPGLAGVATPISDIAMIFINNDGKLDKNVRLAATTRSTSRRSSSACCAATACRSTRWRRPNTRPTTRPSRSAYDPDQAAKLLAGRGYSPQKPFKTTIQTTRGFKPKDYEMIQAIVGMWRKVGIEADIEVYEIAKHFELRTSHKLAPLAFYNWGNAIGDPSTSTGLRHVRPVAALELEERRPRRHDRPALGREGRGQAHRRLQGGRPLHRRERLRDPAAAVRAADRVQGRPQGHAQRLGRHAAHPGHQEELG